MTLRKVGIYFYIPICQESMRGIKMTKYCPNCGKKLKTNYFKNILECPQIKTKRERNVGCGFINKQEELKILRF
jgi:predicted amidophosphoribosyltransferase